MSGNSAYAQLEAQDAAAYGIPPALFQAQIQQESGGNPYALSSAGAEGIAQFMPGTAQEFGINPFDPTQALQAAAEYDAQNYAQFGNWTQALEAYNGGPTNIANGIVPAQSSAYAQTILQNSGENNMATGSPATTSGTTTNTATTPSTTTPASTSSSIIPSSVSNFFSNLTNGNYVFDAVFIALGIGIIFVGIAGGNTVKLVSAMAKSGG